MKLFATPTYNTPTPPWVWILVLLILIAAIMQNVVACLLLIVALCVYVAYTDVRLFLRSIGLRIYDLW
jgi:hypothetical protein